MRPKAALTERTLEAFATRGPDTVRHRGRAVAARDYETMAREASPAYRTNRCSSFPQ